MRLTRTAGYGISALLQLAKMDGGMPVSCTRLAENRKLPERFLLQVMRRLVTHGILRSTRGIEGGYTFLKKPDDVSLLDVIEAIDGPLATEVPPEIGIPDDALGRLTQVVDAANADLKQRLSSVKIAQLAGIGGGGRKRK